MCVTVCVCVTVCLSPLPDLRTEQCYLKHEDERCGAPISGRHRVDACCCSVGVAWGPECDECPEKGSPEYALLCPRGPGFSHRGDFINGRPFLKGRDRRENWEGLCMEVRSVLVDCEVVVHLLVQGWRFVFKSGWDSFL